MTEKKTSNAKLPGDAYTNSIRARFWLVGKDDAYAGVGRISLLEKVHEFGSINRAAKEMGMSYKRAWKLIDEMNGMFDEPLVIREHGGKSGGGTQVTEKGLLVIDEFHKLEAKLQTFLKEASADLPF